jgi:hypothetical protein
MTSVKNKRTTKKPNRILDGILPFTEKPSNQYFNEKDDELAADEIHASDLFSFFTADIIKEKVVFVR